MKYGYFIQPQPPKELMEDRNYVFPQFSFLLKNILFVKNKLNFSNEHGGQKKDAEPTPDIKVQVIGKKYYPTLITIFCRIIHFDFIEAGCYAYCSGARVQYNNYNSTIKFFVNY